MKKNLVLPIFGLLVLGICAFFFINQKEPKNEKTLNLPSTLFETIGFFDQKALQDKELDNFFIVNFFASWCKPCLAEHPLLMELKAQGIKIIGINFRDDENNFMEWIEFRIMVPTVFLQPIRDTKRHTDRWHFTNGYHRG